MKVAHYYRISTKSQCLQNQKNELCDFSASKNYDVVAEYEDVMSGKKGIRPALTEMMKDARSGKFDAVVVVSISRLGRNLQNCIGTINTLHNLKSPVHIIAVSEGLNFAESDSVMQKLACQLFAVMAETFLDLQKDAIMAGIRRKQLESPNSIGRPQSKIDWVRVRQMLATGASYRSVGRDQGCSATTILRKKRIMDELQADHGVAV